MKEELSEKIKSNFTNSIPILIEAFVAYYGEEYRNFITEKIKNIEFIFYCDDKEKNPVFNITKPASVNFNQIKPIYSALVRNIREKTKRYILSPGLKSTLLLNKEKVVFTTADLQSFDPEEIRRLNENIRENNTLQQSRINGKNYKQKIYIPLFFAGDKQLIHEIIHAIKRNLIGTADGFTIDKMGLSVYEDDIFIDEIITDIEADKIYDIFKTYGHNIIEEYSLYEKITSFYDHFKILVANFYNNFKKQIIYAGITLNKNHLVETIGKDNYLEFNKILKEIYDHISDNLKFYIHYDEKQKGEVLRPYQKIINDIVTKMLAHQKIDIENPENIEAYLEYLESLGCKVKRSEKSL